MKSQRITFLVLLVVSALLILEYYRKQSPSPSNPEKNQESPSPVAPASDTSPPQSAADSIAAVYSSYSFKDEQMKFERVKSASIKNQDKLAQLYQEAQLDQTSLRIYLRAFKKEEALEVWARDSKRDTFALLTQYKFCKNSGTLGPKRQEGDSQIPEGFYRVNSFNPQSNYHLSLGLNYPNRSDKVLSDSLKPGSDIFIHGNCVTVGCIPITDEKIEELYLIAVDAKAADQKRIPVSIFPSHLDSEGLAQLKQDFAQNPEFVSFWENLQDGYLFFEDCHKLPRVTFLSTGRLEFRSGCE